ncbi:hypothetical protein [Pseudomonas sp. Irchel s3h9]|uniref:hypothetical protein n=1 Tax=Pseudomonas sp. Irchel s3h9 TaxID=2009192 RepID=UPI000BA38E1D|nr:hypothetical protein [Pseudomonas sp. Irchel s3h9]
MLKEQWVCDETLLAQMQAASAEEIDVLVDVISDFGRGRAGLDAECKKQLILAKHDPRADRYSAPLLALLGHELQQFGGNSAMNLARRALGLTAVAYSEIVDDVYKKLNGKSPADKPLAQKEREIALALFGAEWREMPAAQRHERSTHIKVLSGTFSLASALGLGASGTIMGLSAGGSAALFTAVSTGLRLNPLGLLVTAGIGAQSAAAEAYRVTVPFVAQMGWIRLRQEADAQAPVAPKLANPATLAGQGAALQDMVLADEAGGTLMKISVFDRAPVITGSAIPAGQLSALNPLLSNVPGLAALAELQNGNYVVCSLPFETLTKAKDQEGAVRAFVTESGRIKENAHLFSPDNLQNIMLSGALWNAVSSAVGQKHLHDINEKLSAIKRQLDEVQEDLINLRRDDLTGLVGYVQSLLDHYPQEGIDAAALMQLENRQVDLVALETYFEREMNKEVDKAKAVETGKLFNADSSRVALLESLSRMDIWVQSYLQVTQLRVVAYALLHMEKPLARYRTEAAKVLDNLQRLTVTAAANQQIYSAQMELSNTLFFSGSADNLQRFKSQLAALDNDLKNGPINARQLHRSLFDQSDRQVLLQVQNGQFIGGHLLESTFQPA